MHKTLYFILKLPLLLLAGKPYLTHYSKYLLLLKYSVSVPQTITNLAISGKVI